MHEIAQRGLDGGDGGARREIGQGSRQALDLPAQSFHLAHDDELLIRLLALVPARGVEPSAHRFERTLQRIQALGIEVISRLGDLAHGGEVLLGAFALILAHRVELASDSVNGALQIVEARRVEAIAGRCDGLDVAAEPFDLTHHQQLLIAALPLRLLRRVELARHLFNDGAQRVEALGVDRICGRGEVRDLAAQPFHLTHEEKLLLDALAPVPAYGREFAGHLIDIGVERIETRGVDGGAGLIEAVHLAAQSFQLAHDEALMVGSVAGVTAQRGDLLRHFADRRADVVKASGVFGVLAGAEVLDFAAQTVELAHDRLPMAGAFARFQSACVQIARDLVDRCVEIVEALRINCEGRLGSLRAKRALVSIRRGSASRAGLVEALVRLIVQSPLAQGDFGDGVAQRPPRGPARRRLHGGGSGAFLRPLARIAFETLGDIVEAAVETGQGLFEFGGPIVVRETVETRFQPRQGASDRARAGGGRLLRDFVFDTAETVDDHAKTIMGFGLTPLIILDQRRNVLERFRRVTFARRNALLDDRGGAFDGVLHDDFGVHDRIGVARAAGDRRIVVFLLDASRRVTAPRSRGMPRYGFQPGFAAGIIVFVFVIAPLVAPVFGVSRCPANRAASRLARIMRRLLARIIVQILDVSGRRLVHLIIRRARPDDDVKCQLMVNNAGRESRRHWRRSDVAGVDFPSIKVNKTLNSMKSGRFSFIFSRGRRRRREARAGASAGSTSDDCGRIAVRPSSADAAAGDKSVRVARQRDSAPERLLPRLLRQPSPLST